MAKFIDEIRIYVQAGHGGHGAVTFHKEKFVEFGGPDGGDGGKGGDVIFQANRSLQTLDKYLPEKTYTAEDGHPGQKRNRSGSKGEDLILHVPLGTQIFRTDTQELLFDFKDEKDFITIARGGRGGKGNAFFKSSTHQAPKFSQDGEEGSWLTLTLSLKLLADVGIVGLPNSGKSTLLSKITHAHPKIAGYAFTTLSPNLGVVVRHGDSFRYTMADIPGIIEGASQGHGLGLSFLRHIERVKGILFVFDASSIDIEEDFKMLQHELEAYNPNLLTVPHLIAFNKIDIWENDANFTQDLLEKFSHLGRIIPISAVEETNLEQLLDAIDEEIFQFAVETT
ncbi:MAG: GTPase ObgE [Spirochaetota bacterium]